MRGSVLSELSCRYLSLHRRMLLGEQLIKNHNLSIEALEGTVELESIRDCENGETFDEGVRNMSDMRLRLKKNDHGSQCNILPGYNFKKNKNKIGLDKKS